MTASRTAYVKKNILYSYTCTIITSIFALVCRTLFVYKLGADYMGVSDLFTNVLGILSFSELGIGTAIVFSLYKPIAENNQEKIKSLLNLYKNAYRVIAAVISGLGILLFPFLKYLVNIDIPMEEIHIYYLVFLFNTVSSYCVSYKTSYISAIQKNYIITNIGTIGVIVTNLFQIIALYLGGSYFTYLIVTSIIGLLQKIITVVYLNKKYPILVEKSTIPLDKETKDTIWQNVKAMIAHKIGDIAVNQTDNIIISIMLSTTMVGLVSNYTTLNALIASLSGAIFSGTIASVGNLVAKESKMKQKEVFEEFDFLGFWIYGFILIAFITLSQPFITLWLGEEMLVDNLTMILFFVSKYLEGLCVVTYNFKVAGGRFNEDKWVPFMQAAVNLCVSIIAIKLIGLPGVYVGTIAQRLIVNYVRPHIVYKYVLQADEKKYFERFLVRLVILASLGFGMWKISRAILTEITIFRFCIVVLLTVIIPNAVIIILNYRTPMFRNLLKRVMKREGESNAFTTIN